jgi:uncharacterized protein YndB with AHSA1/START domain
VSSVPGGPTNGADYWKVMSGAFPARPAAGAGAAELRPPVQPGPIPSTLPDLSDATARFPVLQAQGAQTLVRDRWERLVSGVVVPQPPEEVWQALTSPNALQKWLGFCRGTPTQTDKDWMLDFEDGEFFLCRTRTVERPHRIEHWWRWLGVGQATLVSWRLERAPEGTRVTVVEEAANPPADWQTWNGGGWCGILNQLAMYLRTGTEWRWPWRRMGPYTQIELPVPFYMAWERLMSPMGLRFWLQLMHGEDLTAGEKVTLMMGDASGMVDMRVVNVVQPGERPPSFLPSVDFALQRPVWGAEVLGRLWLEPCGWGRTLLQVFHFNWENVSPGVQLGDRKILTSYWAGAATRALTLFSAPGGAGPHSW